MKYDGHRHDGITKPGEHFDHDYLLDVTSAFCYAPLVMRLTSTSAVAYALVVVALALCSQVFAQYPAECSLPACEAEHLPAVGPFSSYEVLA
jgi:hypothetical protein